MTLPLPNAAAFPPTLPLFPPLPCDGRGDGSHYIYTVRSLRIERVGAWLPQGWLARALSAGAEVVFTESDTVTVRPDAAVASRRGAAGGANGGGANGAEKSVDRTLRRAMRLRRAKWLPGAEWRVVDVRDAASA